MTNKEVIDKYLEFSRYFDEEGKQNEIKALRSLPEGNYYIFHRWNNKEDILFKSQFTLELSSHYEGFNNKTEEFIILK